MEQYNIEFDEYSSFKKNLEESLKKSDKEKITDMDAFHNSIFVSLKDEKENVFLEDYGLFIIFLLLLKVEKDEWQWVEEQISDYIKDLIDIIKVMEQDINVGTIISYIIENMDEVENNIEKYTSMVIEKRKSEKEEFYKNNINNEAELTYDFLIQILKRKTKNYLDKTEKYLNDKKKIEKLNVVYRNYTQNIRHKIRYIYFSLQIFLKGPILDLKFDNKNLEIINNDNLQRISLKEELHRFENHFGNYALKVNEYIMNILNKDLERNVIKNEFIDIELSLKSEIEKRLKRIFGFETRDKRIISFNYTTYLNYYKNNFNRNIPIKNLKELINVNGNVDDYKKINDELKYRERKNIEKIRDKIKNELKELIKEVQEQCKTTDEYFIEKLNKLETTISNINLSKIKKINKLWKIIEETTNINYKDIHIEDKYKEKLKNILSPNKKEYNTEIIFGIDEIQKDKNYKELNEFFKSKRRNGKLEEKINELLKRQFSKIYFYGHSLADADYTFFEDLFNKTNIDNSEIKLIFLYAKGYSCEENVRNLMNKYAGRNAKVVDYMDKLQKEGKLELKEVCN